MDALKFQMKNLRDGFDEQRLGQTRRAGDQAMSAGKERDENLLDHFLLADDDFGEFGFDSGAAGDEAFDGFAFGSHGGSGGSDFRGFSSWMIQFVVV